MKELLHEANNARQILTGALEILEDIAGKVQNENNTLKDLEQIESSAVRAYELCFEISNKISEIRTKVQVRNMFNEIDRRLANAERLLGFNTSDIDKIMGGIDWLDEVGKIEVRS